MKNLYLLFAVVFIQACAFTDAKLAVEHDPEGSFQGPLSSIETKSFQSAILEDNREDKERIGWKKNGFGANTADITTSLPVTEIVSNAITAGLESNSHELADDGRIMITGSVETFWFETDINFWTVQFSGDVQCSLEFIDNQTGESFYSGNYSGNYSENVAAGLEGTWTRILSKAVDNLIEDIVFDEDLVEAIADLE